MLPGGRGGTPSLLQAAAGTVIRLFEEYDPEHRRRHKTGQIAHHRPSLTAWIG